MANMNDCPIQEGSHSVIHLVGILTNNVRRDKNAVALFVTFPTQPPSESNASVAWDAAVAAGWFHKKQGLRSTVSFFLRKKVLTHPNGCSNTTYKLPSGPFFLLHQRIATLTGCSIGAYGPGSNHFGGCNEVSRHSLRSTSNYSTNPCGDHHRGLRRPGTPASPYRAEDHLFSRL